MNIILILFKHLLGLKTNFVYLAEALQENKSLTDVKIHIPDLTEQFKITSLNLIESFCLSKTLLHLTVKFENGDIVSPISTLLRENSSIKTLHLNGM